ncbi:hypothetical protein NDR87_00890 [Nocardia sp. CDC159]|uniref:SnoaL-like domain-containing protein n=1 Tax=Nocardia pulmonis TaxID=2951408 RepID=A0A9X2E2H3_9NOCA|nr:MULTISPECIES: hypothetical protein [Nocardia]MCM6772431.1 hypothetical protein [Nocardia pulmonis]MCM6784911.1 hypothetical protein [Nocardia sp. CDC159]
MDQAAFANYIALYNTADYRRVVDTYYAEDVSVVVFGWTVARGAQAVRDWLIGARRAVSETLLVQETEFDEFGLRVWARACQILVARSDIDLAEPGQPLVDKVHIVPVSLQFLLRGDRIARILVEEGPGTAQVLRPERRSHVTGYRRGQSVAVPVDEVVGAAMAESISARESEPRPGW